MPTERLSMRRIREVLRLRHQGLTERVIARTLGVSNGVVHGYVRRARLAGLTWPLPEGLDDFVDKVIPELQARNYQVRMLGERLAVNTVIQGTAADIIKLAMVRTHAALAESGLQTRLLLTIHDELLFEGPPAESADASALVEREMCGVWKHDPPLAVDVGVGLNWLEAK